MQGAAAGLYLDGYVVGGGVAVLSLDVGGNGELIDGRQGTDLAHRAVHGPDGGTIAVQIITMHMITCNQKTQQKCVLVAPASTNALQGFLRV